VQGSFVVSKDSKELLRDALGRWCQRRHEQQGSSLLISRKIGLPPKQTDKLVSSAAMFMCMLDVTADAILKIIKLDLLSPAEVCKVEKVIHDWREDVVITATPSRKKGCPIATPATPVTQPSFAQHASVWIGNHTHSTQGEVIHLNTLYFHS